ncbi:MAG TPA: L-histidine N(alpha)-methyltransferase, partial [Abditibacteriaceae bacterium]|nr:L-histidine N(alpha)-methyltransferase [Abditibacteriaceae bacterium]
MMTGAVAQQIDFHDFEPQADCFREEVLHGLQQPQKELPCKYFYDERGSHLFDQICRLEEYYPTRTELAIMQEHAGAMAQLLGRGCLLIEYGSGSSLKTRVLLDHLAAPAAYVPIDISRAHLMRSAGRLAAAYPGLKVLPVCADYTTDFTLPTCHRPIARKAVYFPGSTIGNFDPTQAQNFLCHIAEICGVGGGLLIGIDLKKDACILEPAYNDARGVTAAFNLNLLRRINRELGADFQLDRFQHYAFYNEELGRIEMHLV